MIEKIKKSRYHLLFSVLPVVIIIALFKTGIHFLGWELIPKEMSSFFPSILTGIIFLLGFLLAGVVADYKESEKIPNEMAASLFAIWQETDFISKVSGLKSAGSLMGKLKTFIPTVKKDFFIERNNKLDELFESISKDIVELGKEGAVVNYVTRIKTELAGLKKNVNRINVIKTTDFVPSVFISIQTISVIFLIVYSMLKVDPWWGGLIIVSIFAFVIFSILYLIRDMDDPFEYDGTDEVKSDEVSLEVLDNLQKELFEN
ncbi:MAG TPA: hypothetical protein VMT63_07275 [Bacteroidales bacterium]|nr:hypothetical protein [Bacteroidales bacterium]